jgi:tetratricopeptide (TPR) repeat protein
MAALALVVIQKANIDPIRADGSLKSASALAKRGAFEPALRLLERARRLAPREPMYALIQGRTALAAADRAPEGAARERLFELAESSLEEARELAPEGLFELAESSLEEARELAPLDPDHHANLARSAVARAVESSDADRRARMLDRAVAGYRAALALRPRSVVLLNEYGRLLINMGRRAEARRVLERAVALDPSFDDPKAALEILDGIEGSAEPGL